MDFLAPPNALARFWTSNHDAKHYLRHPVLTNLSRERAKLRRIAFGRERPNSASGTAFFPSVPTSLELSVIIDVTGLRQTKEENKKRDHRWRTCDKAVFCINECKVLLYLFNNKLIIEKKKNYAIIKS